MTKRLPRERLHDLDDEEPTPQRRRRIICTVEPPTTEATFEPRRQTAHALPRPASYNLLTDENGLVVRGPGRPAGVPNRTTALIKAAITGAGEDVGEDGHGKDGLRGYCRWLAKHEPNAYVQLLKRILPQQVHASVDPQSVLGQILEGARARLTFEKSKVVEADAWKREYPR